MSAAEEVLLLACGGDTLLGIVSRPTGTAAAHEVGVVIVVGGPQYRAGSHRQFVQLARTLASAGHTVLRFDVRGMGDSTGSSRSFEALSEDIGAAVDALLQTAPGLRTVVLMGLCDGASAALMLLAERPHPHVAGLCLLNPWLRSDSSLAQTHVRSYYGRRLLSGDFWRKLLRGGVGAGALAGFVHTLRSALRREPARSSVAAQADFRERMLQGWRSFAGPVLLVLSDNDLTAQEFDGATRASAAWRRVLETPQVRRVRLAGADHTLSDASAQGRFEQEMLGWLAGPAFLTAASAQAAPAR